MGKASTGEQGLSGHLVDEACNAVHNARDVIAALAQAMVPAGETELAGRLFVIAERLRIEAFGLRIDFTPSGVRGPVETPGAKPARVRGPRKPKASAAARTGNLLPDNAPPETGNLAGATRGLKDSNDRLASNLAGGGAS